jgi:hypothetical protein
MNDVEDGYSSKGIDGSMSTGTSTCSDHHRIRSSDTKRLSWTMIRRAFIWMVVFLATALVGIGNDVKSATDITLVNEGTKTSSTKPKQFMMATNDLLASQRRKDKCK